MTDSGAYPIVWLQGSFFPAEQAAVSIFDRSFLYGDGLFETIRMYNGQPFRWDEHLARLKAGAGFLGIPLPYSDAELRAAVRELVHRNEVREGIVRISLSRGVGIRGYSTRGANRPQMTAVLYTAPRVDPERSLQWKLATASIRIASRDPLTSFKSSNKLLQILAKREAEAVGADEALILNTDGHVAEAATSNVFWIENRILNTPPLQSGALAGITRVFVAELVQSMGIGCRESLAGVDVLRKSDGVFLTNCSLEIVSAVSIDGFPLRSSPMVREIHAAYRAAAKAEI